MSRAHARCLVVGAGGHAKVAIRALMAQGVVVEGVFDDDPTKVGSRLLGLEVQGPSALAAVGGLPVHLAIGSNHARRTLARSLKANWMTAVHPESRIDPSASLGEGALICMSATLQVDCRIGRHTIINTSAVIEHDCVVGDYVHIAPGTILAGDVHIEDEVFVGIGVRVLPGVTIGAAAVVGAGAVVIDDVAPATCVVGVPARLLKRTMGEDHG